MAEPQPTAASASPSRSRLALGLGTSWLAVSSSAVVIVTAAPVPPLAIAAIRVALSGLVWLLIAAVKRSTLGGRSLPWGRIALSGFLIGAHFGCWVGSLFLTSVPHAAVLVALQPLFGGIFGKLLGDRATWRLPAGVAIALLGTRLMTGAESEGVTLVGDLVAVLAAACSAAYLSVNRGIGTSVPLPILLGLVNAIGATCLAVAVFAFGGGAFWHELAGGNEVLALLWLGIGPGFLGHGLMNWAARSVPVHIVSMAVLLEPIGAALLAWHFLGQSVTLGEMLGGALLLLGAGLTLLDRPEVPDD